MKVDRSVLKQMAETDTGSISGTYNEKLSGLLFSNCSRGGNVIFVRKLKISTILLENDYRENTNYRRKIYSNFCFLIFKQVQKLYIVCVSPVQIECIA